MRVSRSFINFALFSCIVIASACFSSCKGRTMENMEPTGDTVEVVILQDSDQEINQQQQNLSE